MKRLLLVISVVTLLTSCVQPDKDHVIVRTGDHTFYRVKRNTIEHKDNGCIGFKNDQCDCGEETNVTVCGTFTIEE